MIVPRNKLLVGFAVIVLPLLAAGSAVQSAAPLAFALIVLFVVVAAGDASLSALRLAGIVAEFPSVVRLSAQKKKDVIFSVTNKKARPLQLRIGLAFPEAIEAEPEELNVNISAQSEPSSFGWFWTGTKRGHYKFDKCYLEAASPLGLWSFRSPQPVKMEVRVYPSLAREAKSLSALFLNRGMPGIHRHRQLGQGREFEKLREYVHGDSYDRIHWKATARRSRPVTKVFQIEKTQEVYVIIDASRLSARAVETLSHDSGPAAAGQSSTTVLERYITAALLMGLAAQKQGDMFGLLSYADCVRNFVRAKTGPAHFNVCRDAVYKLEPQIVNPDFEELFMFIGQRLRRRALLVFLTHLDDPVLAESFLKNAALISRKHIVIVNMMRPSGLENLFHGGKADTTDDVYRALAGHMMLENLMETAEALALKGVKFSLLENEKLCPQMVSQYINIKQRQLL